jgi:hypothetical protein
MSDAELIARLRLYGSKFHHEFGHNDAADRIEALTAKLAKAEAGLRDIAAECGCSIARATLAEIKGESHERHAL